MDRCEARDVAGDFLARIMHEAFAALTIEDIEETFDVTTGDAMQILFEMGQADYAIGWEPGDCSCGAEELFEVGDPDPMIDFKEVDYECCPMNNGTYYCTLPVNHYGKHIAGDGTEVCAVWE